MFPHLDTSILFVGCLAPCYVPYLLAPSSRLGTMLDCWDFLTQHLWLPRESPPARLLEELEIIPLYFVPPLFPCILSHELIPLQGGGPGLQEPLQLGELDITSDEFILDEVDGE